MKLAALINSATIDRINNSAVAGNTVTILKNIKDIALGILTIALPIIFFLIIAFGVYGGILYFTAYGNEEKIKKGKLTMVWAIVGAVVIAGAFMIVRYIASKLLGVPESTINQGLNP